MVPRGTGGHTPGREGGVGGVLRERGIPQWTFTDDGGKGSLHRGGPTGREVCVPSSTGRNRPGGNARVFQAERRAKDRAQARRTLLLKVSKIWGRGHFAARAITTDRDLIASLGMFHLEGEEVEQGDFKASFLFLTPCESMFKIYLNIYNAVWTHLPRILNSSHPST